MVDNEKNALKIDWRVINWMRGLAAFYVVINHSRGHLFTDMTQYANTVKPKSSWGILEWLDIALLQQTNLGTEFVILFFILSGFSIAHSLTNNSTGVIGFYKRRAVRLYPPYLLGICWAIIVFVLVRYFAPDIFYTGTEDHLPLAVAFDKFKTIPTLLSNLIYIPKDNYLTPQYWSLPFEVLFYLVAPWAIKKMKWYGILTIAFYILGWIIKGYIYFDDEIDPIIPQFLTDYNIYFLVGMLIYINRSYLIDKYKLNSKLSFILVLFLFEALVITKSYLFHQVSNKFTGIIMIGFSFIVLIAGLKYNLRYKWLERVGVFSYTLYISHFASIYLLKLILYKAGLNFYNINAIYAWYLGILISVTVAGILYYFAEYPAIKYLEKRRQSKIITS